MPTAMNRKPSPPPAPTSLTALDRAHVWHPFTQEATAPEPIEIVSAQGATLTAADGREFLDLIASWWVNVHGHAHPAIAAAISAQAAQLEQVIFAGFTHRPAVELASRLSALLPEDLNRVFYSDDGSTAVEVALKLAVQYWRNRGESRPRILAFQGGYHGDTVGAMSAGRASGFFDAFDSMLFRVEHLPFPQTWLGATEAETETEARERAALAALEGELERHPGEIAALIIEPLVQGAGGMRMCRPQFLQALGARCAEAGVLVIFDEVMTGFGRTGALFACHRAQVTPDLICLSKGLTGGFLPLAATVCRDRIYETFLGDGFARAFAHGHSFTANPLGCAAALASLALFEEGRSLERIARIEAFHRQAMTELSRHPAVTRPRVTGTIAAFDLAGADQGYAAAIGPWLKAAFLERGLLIRPLGNVVYLLPPYCITQAELGRAYAGIEGVLQALPG
jgi:adenosylmethionine-8-amino-7-oxononanoate aminotransferase